MAKLFRLVLLGLMCSTKCTHAQPAHQELWLAPLAREFNGKKWGAGDFLKLFDDDAKWQTVAKNINVLKFYPTFIGSASEAQLRAVFDNLKRRGIKIALEGSMLTAEEGCGAKVSGDSGEFTKHLVERIRQFDGELDYLVMNEPLLHAYRQKQRLCAVDVEAMAAANVLKTIREVTKVFPNVQIGDVEAIGLWKGTEDLPAAIARWSDAFAAVTGRKLAFVDADVGWILPWVDVVGRLGDEMHGRGIPFGVIYNGMDTDLSDEAWVESAERHFLRYENSGYRRPDRAIFQSWADYPHQILPEDGRHTLTSLVLSYLRRPVSVNAQRVGWRVSGSLVDDRKTAVADTSVSLSSRPLNGPGPAGWGLTTGIVPEGATRASFTISMNTECACEAPSSIILHGFRYSQRGNLAAKLVSFDRFHDWKSRGSGKVVIADSSAEIVTGMGQQTHFESPEFPVTAGAEFDARALFQAPFDTDRGGLGIIKFFDDTNKELRFTYILLEPKWTKLAETMAAKDGTFSFALDRKINPADVELKITSAGSKDFRPSSIRLSGRPHK